MAASSWTPASIKLRKPIFFSITIRAPVFSDERVVTARTISSYTLPPNWPRGQFGGSVYDEIVLAVTTLSTEKTGALIVIEKDIGLRNFIDAGVQLDAAISYDLLVTIFNPATPLHDGAVIIQNERIAAASVFLPLTKNPGVSREMGTRHRAAIGITEGTDAVSLVVSEETGLITFVENGEVRRNIDATQLRSMMLKAMEMPMIEKKRDTAKPMKEAETEITIG